MRKWTVLWPVLVGSVVLFAQGCADQGMLGLQDIIREEKNAGEAESTTEPREYEPEQPQSDSTQEQQDAREVSELYYAYHHLDGEKQKIYLEVLDALTGMKSGVPLSTLDLSLIHI